MVLGSAWNMQINCFAYFKDWTVMKNLSVPGSGLPLWNELFQSMVGRYGKKRSRPRALLFTFPYLRHQSLTIKIKIMNTGKVDIILVEDNPDDAELSIRALNKNRITNVLIH